MITINVKRMDGSKWFTVTCDFSYQWTGITHWVMDEMGCDYSDIDMMESNDGDVLMVKGEVVGMMNGQRS